MDKTSIEVDKINILTGISIPFLLPAVKVVPGRFAPAPSFDGAGLCFSEQLSAPAFFFPCSPCGNRLEPAFDTLHAP